MCNFYAKSPPVLAQHVCILRKELLLYQGDYLFCFSARKAVDNLFQTLWFVWQTFEINCSVSS